MKNEKKSLFQQLREAKGWSRDEASEQLEIITPERLERIEKGKFAIHPDEVLLMAEKYNAPELVNYYCSKECPIGQRYVPEVKIKDLSQIVLEMLASLNSMQKQQENLIEITADGKIDNSEINKFIEIQNNLEKISITVETLQLWTEQMIATGAIDAKAYKEAKKNS